MQDYHIVLRSTVQYRRKKDTLNKIAKILKETAGAAGAAAVHIS